MLSKKEIKDIQSLSHKKFRNELKLFVAEGPKIVRELMSLIPSMINNIYGTKEWIQTLTPSEREGVSEISREELEKISDLKTPNQVIAVIRQFENREPSNQLFTLYLDTIQDPGNLGTIIRIADWFGVKQVVCSTGCAELYNQKVIQATMASIARVQVYYDEKGDWLSGQAMPVYAATLDGRSLYEHHKIVQGILVIGNESKGISEEVLKFAQHRITIPKRGEAESLNAAVATGVILSHLLG